MADDTEEFTTKEIYGILSMEHPDEGDLNKLKELINKEGSSWKDAIPDEFMEKAFPKYSKDIQLGLLKPEHIAEVSNIIKNLQTIDATETLKHFVNNNNTPNGDSAVTYLARHNLSAQYKIDSGKLPDADARELKRCSDAQLEILEKLADLKDENNEHIVNFATYNKHEQNLKELAKTYSDGIGYRNTHLEDGASPMQDPARNLEQFFERVDKDAEKYQTNIGSNEENNTPSKQLPENVANFDPNAPIKDKSKRNKDYHSRDIKAKDVIDFFYEDIFLYYLNKGTDWILGHMKNAVDRYADWCKQSGDNLDRAADKMNDANCKAATKKITTEYHRLDDIRNGFAGTRDERKAYMDDLNKVIDRNLINPVAGAPENWEPLDINNPADKQLIESLKRSSQAAADAGSDKFKTTFEAMKQNDNMEKMLNWQETTHDLGYMLALTEWKHECLNDEKLKCLKIENLAEDEDFQAKVLKYTQVVNAGVAAAMAIDMLNGDTTYTSVQNFLNNTVDQALKLEKTLDKDIKAENFKANPKKEKHPTASNEAYEDFTKLIDDTVKFAGSAHILPHNPMYEARSIKEEASTQIKEIKNSPHNKEQILVNASQAANAAALQANQKRGLEFKKLKEKLFGAKDNKFAQAIKTSSRGRS